MKLIIKIAVRSLIKHKGKMIAIASLVCLGTILMIFGGALTESIKYFSHKAIIDNFTGDFVIYAQKAKDKPTPFAFISPLPNIANTDEIMQKLRMQTEIKTSVAYTQNFAAVMPSDGETTLRDEAYIVFYAIEPKTYREVFNNINIIEGSYFGVDDSPTNYGYTKGIILEKKSVKMFRDEYKKDLKVGDFISVLAFTGVGSVNAQKVPIIGIFEYKYFKNMLGEISFMDMETYSELFNFVGLEKGYISEAFDKTLQSESEEDIFATADIDFEKQIDTKKIKMNKLSGYTMISLLLDSKVDRKSYRQNLEAMGKELGFKVASWNEASGGLDKLSSSFQLVVYIISIIIFIVVAIIITNTFIINIFERTFEIGTMRAIGGKKSLIRSLFYMESLIINVLAGLTGIIISTILILIFGKAGIPLPPFLAEILFGGGKLFMNLDFMAIINTLIILVIVAVLATWYPVRLATKITPLKAMSDKT